MTRAVVEIAVAIVAVVALVTVAIATDTPVFSECEVNVSC